MRAFGPAIAKWLRAGQCWWHAVIMFTSHIVGHRTLAVLYVLVGANGLGSIITELWPWVLYPPLYVATAVLLLITLRRERSVASAEPLPAP
jgi:hypothetical protein